MALIGYARVSTADQETDLQEDALRAAGCERVLTDRASGAQARRPELDHALDLLRVGDTLVVWRLDRLGRSLRNLIDLVGQIRSRGAGLRSLRESIDTGTPAGQLTFHLFGALAEFERELIRERVRAGLAAARVRGRAGGRPAALSADQVAIAMRLYAEGRPVSAIAGMLRVHRATVYRSLKGE